MPLYIEILDRDHSASDAAVHRGADVSILSSWTSETTGGTVRLVEAPDASASTRASGRAMRLLHV